MAACSWRPQHRALPLLLAVALTPPLAQAAPVMGYEVVATYPHDPKAFTQGLIYEAGHLYESTGMLGRSSVRQVELASGEVTRRYSLPGNEFGEGLTAWGKTLVTVTWKNGRGYVFDRHSLSVKTTFPISGEGWGLTRYKGDLVLSDGTSDLRFISPRSFKEKRRVQVTADGAPVLRLNELEVVNGEIWANIWESDRIACIDPRSGKVLRWIDLSNLLERSGASLAGADVLNGIAYDERRRRIFVTGKQWPLVFEIRPISRNAAIGAR